MVGPPLFLVFLIVINVYFTDEELEINNRLGKYLDNYFWFSLFAAVLIGIQPIMLYFFNTNWKDYSYYDIRLIEKPFGNK